MPLVGRKWSLVFSALCQGLAMAMYTQVKSTVGFVSLNALEYIMQTYFNAVLYASAPELFDTTYRGSASGMLSCIGRLAGIAAPFAGKSPNHRPPPLLFSKKIINLIMLQVNNTLPIAARVSCGSVPVVSGLLPL